MNISHSSEDEGYISEMRHHREINTQEAADILNVLQPFLVKLLENGEIPHIKVGSHRRILFQDVMIYQEQRKVKRSQGLRELTQFLQDEGFYEESISNLAE